MTVPVSPIKLLVADVDGTLVTPDKALTTSTVEVVKQLGAAGILFAVVSGRPPRGMKSLIDPLGLTTPLAAFNGGLIVDPALHTLQQKVLPTELVTPIIESLRSHALDVWIYRGHDWFVENLDGPHVARERQTVQFAPRLTENYSDLTDGVVKIVGVSDDTAAIQRATQAVHDRFGHSVSAAASQPYYLDVTHPEANKGAVVQYLAARYRIAPGQIAAIGDMANDVLMFAHARLGIAMGNASADVKRTARRVTASNAAEGFAKAVQRFILSAPPEAPPPTADSSSTEPRP